MLEPTRKKRIERQPAPVKKRHVYRGKRTSEPRERGGWWVRFHWGTRKSDRYSVEKQLEGCAKRIKTVRGTMDAVTAHLASSREKHLPTPQRSKTIKGKGADARVCWVSSKRKSHEMRKISWALPPTLVGWPRKEEKKERKKKKKEKKKGLDSHLSARGLNVEGLSFEKRQLS